MVIFNASIMHRATTFRSSHRFTVAIKYQWTKYWKDVFHS
jgi:hypothetical protein